MDPDDNQLHGMDLVQRGDDDSIIENEYEWTERKKCMTYWKIPLYWKTNLVTNNTLK